jgi:hypothetical protein
MCQGYGSMHSFYERSDESSACIKTSMFFCSVSSCQRKTARGSPKSFFHESS